MIGSDITTTSIIHNRLLDITQEMGYVMMRTSRSPILSEARDFTTGIFDDECRLIAAAEYIPIQIGAGSFAVRSVRDFFKDDIRQGDVFILNDPYWGGNHLLDVTVLSPVYYKNKLVFWLVNRGQHADLGGTMPGGYYPRATEIFQEGVRIPPLKLRESGSDRKDVWNMLQENSRAPKSIYNDLRAQLGSLTIGERRVRELIEKYGIEGISASIDFLIKSTESMMLKELKAIPNGEYMAERKIDDNGIKLDSPVTVRVKVTKHDKRLVFDYTGTDPQNEGFINSPFPNTCSATYISIFTLVDPSIPHNEGSMSPLRIIAPSGCLVNPRPPAAHQLDTITTTEAIVETCWLALSHAVPSRVPAAWARQASGVSSGLDPRTGNRFFMIHGFLAKGGAGAIAGVDGLNFMGSICSCGGQRMPSIELHELQAPFVVLQHELRPDSGGPGRWRGGLGVTYKFKVKSDGVVLCKYGDGMKVAPFGLFSGKQGTVSEHWLISSNRRMRLNSKGVYKLNKGDILEFCSGGGGGVGHPHKRARQLVKEDLNDGYISLRSAKIHYGLKRKELAHFGISLRTRPLNFSSLKVA